MSVTKTNHYKLAVLAAAVTGALALQSVAQAQPGANEDRASTPTPRMADGTVDLGGDGVWNLPWVTDFAVRMPGYKEGDQPPMLAWTRAMWEYNKILWRSE